MDSCKKRSNPQHIICHESKRYIWYNHLAHGLSKKSPLADNLKKAQNPEYPKNILLWWFWAKTLYISMEGRSGVGAVFWANTAQLAQNKKDGAKCEPWRYCLHDFMTEPVRYYLTLILKNVELRLYLREHLEPVL